MSIVITSDKHYKDIASKIRNNSPQIKYNPSEMAEAIINLNTFSTYENIASGIIVNNGVAKIMGDKMYPYMFHGGREINELEIPEYITEIPNHAFRNSFINTIILHDNITSIGKHGFYYAHLTTFTLPSNLISIGDSGLAGLQIKEKLVVPSSVTSLGSFAFSYSDWVCIDMLCSVSIPSYCFCNCDYLESLILRNESSVNVLDNSTNVFKNTPIANGTGYIYVPSALLDSYKTATNWSTYANQFRALEDYTVDGTVTGELDESKI